MLPLRAHIFIAVLLIFAGMIAGITGLSVAPLILVNGFVLAAIQVWRRLTGDVRTSLLGYLCGTVALAFGFLGICAVYIAIQLFPLRSQMRHSNTYGEQDRLIFLGFAVVLGLLTWLFARWSRRLLPTL